MVGSDHDLNGINGIGLETAVRFVKIFSEDEILNRCVFLMLVLSYLSTNHSKHHSLIDYYCMLLRLHDVAKGEPLVIQGHNTAEDESASCSNDKSLKLRIPHCSHCGHPGNKKAHLKFSCEHCNSTAGQSCSHKPAGFKCLCTSCDLVQN